MSRFSSNAANASITAALTTINAAKDDTKISANTISSVPSSLLPLLPSTATDFHSKAYWDNFFKERGSKPFEWYGEYSNFSHFIYQYAPSFKESFLVIGCGNSEFSSTLYDAKYTNITNIDFSPIVIQEMKAKNNLKRPHMKWLVSDMTDLKNVVSDDSFHNVVDKGALDALFSEDTAEVRLLVNNMFTEIDRVLLTPPSPLTTANPATASTTSVSGGGKYMCITLAQDFIIKALLQFFSTQSTLSSLYSIVIDVVTNSRSSPKIPFFVCLTKLGNKVNYNSSTNHATINPTNSIPTTSSASSTTAATTTAAGMIAAAEKGLIGVRFNSFGNAVKTTNFITLEETLKLIKSVQEFHDQIYGLGDIQNDRFESMDFWSAQSSSKSEAAAISQVPRFTITILDTDKRPKTRTCAVFIVPVGRESEYQFNTKNGLHDIAMQAECNRLFAIRINKPHTFQNMTSLQEELSPIILTLIPHRGIFSTYDPKLESIPYMSLAQENEWKEVKFGFTIVSGDYIIEEKPADDEESGGNNIGAIIRRLIFLQNQNFIQTECRLLFKKTNNTNNNTAATTADDDKSTMTKSKLKRMKKKQSEFRRINNRNSDSSTANMDDEDNESKISADISTDINTNTDTIKVDEIDIDQSSSQQISSSPYKFDLAYVDDHHRAMLSSFSLLLASPTPNAYANKSSNSGRNVYNSNGINNNSASITGNCTTTIASATSTINFNNVTVIAQSVPQWRGLLVGLGGGSLPICLQHYFPDTYLTIVELDDQIEAIATEFFGFEKLRGVRSSDGKSSSGKTEVIVQDGVDYIVNYANQVKMKMNDIGTNSTNADNGDVDGDVSKNLQSLSITDSTTHPLLSYIIIDVDGKDNSLGLTAPPLAFIHPSVLTQMYTCLLPGGVLIFNVVARGGDEPINALIQQVKLVFCYDSSNDDRDSNVDNDAKNIHKLNDNTEINTKNNSNSSPAAVYLIRPSETTVNVVLIARKRGSVTVCADNIITSAAVNINANFSTSVSTENDNNEENDDVDEKEDDGEIVNGETTTVTTATTNAVTNSKKNRIKKKKAKKKANTSNDKSNNNNSLSQLGNMSSSCNNTTEEHYKNILQQYLIQHHQKINQNNNSNNKNKTNSNSITNTTSIDPLSLLSFIDNLERV